MIHNKNNDIVILTTRSYHFELLSQENLAALPEYKGLFLEFKKWEGSEESRGVVWSTEHVDEKHDQEE